MKTIRLLLIGVWLGSAIFFSAVVAPAAFTVLRAYQIPNATEIAGTIVNRTLAVVNITGFVFSLFALITALVLIERSRSRLFFVEMLSLGVLAVATAIGHWFIAAKMQSLRAAAVLPIDQLAPNDPRKVQFDHLHSYSVMALTIAMIAGLIAFIVIAYRGLSGPAGRTQTWR